MLVLVQAFTWFSMNFISLLCQNQNHQKKKKKKRHNYKKWTITLWGLMVWHMNAIMSANKMAFFGDFGVICLSYTQIQIREYATKLRTSLDPYIEVQLNRTVGPESRYWPRKTSCQTLISYDLICGPPSTWLDYRRIWD